MSVSSDTRVRILTAKTQGDVSRMLTCLDQRLGYIEMVGWPALEASLRAELQESIASAKSRGFEFSGVKLKPEPRQQPSKRTLTCGICRLMTTLLGSTRRIHNGRRTVVCPKCAGFR